MKVERKTLCLTLILLMFLSTFVYALVEKLSYSTKQEKESLPKERIVSSISQNQKILAISSGFTLIYFNYSSTNEIKSYLESLAKNHYVYLIENFGNKDFLKVESLKGSREVENPNLNKTIDLLCQMMIDRPIDCVMREIR